ncbi:TonB-dependent receptor [Odoribacter splanchnicus]|jgi:tonB-dependent receptor plug|nr:TonB-dependent receptor [Odoribacter splanchnicus]MBV4274838.1 TonB-dependent receptor [Odoribacter splanchnicus]MBV4289946.1 TonB-dependent receptor [Odoribacter splanchnicus]MDB9206854.1 TonB-dependent receptor [Odoribacter splanchnicus]MDB9209439.1 TonB-dependent receptor [Odoribacter splanchnicus]MDB9214232.1 TonB-dependent receptor [Odoribacter splanchnicus]
MKKFLWVIGGVLMLWGIPLSGQQSVAPEIPESAVRMTKVSGQVVDENTGDGIPLATISVTGLGWGTVCDMKGYFKVEVPVNQPAELTVRSVGYETKTLVLESDVTGNLVVRLKKSLLNLDEVTVTGTRTEKTVAETPVMTRIVPSEVLQRNDFESMIDVLEYNIPGLRFNTDPRGNNIQVQGLENSYILILVDGERLSTTPGGPIDFDRLTTANIKKIEVLKGAASALYGSSAMGMVINIITDIPKRPLEGWAKVRYGKYNDLQLDAGVGMKYKGFYAQTLFNRTSSDGYDLTPETPESFTENPSHHMTIEEKLGWNNQYSRITVKGSLYWGEVENPWESTAPTHYRSLTKTLQVNAEHAFNDRYKLYGTYAGDFYTRKTVYDFLYLPDSTNAWSHEQTVRLVDEFKPWDNLVIVKGFEWNGTKNYNKMQYGKEKTIRDMDDANLFAQADWMITDRLEVIGGFRYTHNSEFGSAFTPKINLMYSPGNFKIRAGYSRGFKTPGLTELYSDFNMGSVSHNIGNPDLKAEHSDYFSVSGEYTWQGRLMLTAELYQNTVDNKINSYNVDIEDPKPGELGTELRYENVKGVRIRGAEATATYYPVSALLLRTSYAFCDALNKETGLQLSGNSKHAMNWSASLHGKLLKHEGAVTLSGRWDSKRISKSRRTETDDSGQEVEVITTRTKPGYTMWKLTAQYTPWTWKYMRLSVTGGVDNLFDFVDTSIIYDPGRRFFGSLILRF